MTHSIRTSLVAACGAVFTLTAAASRAVPDTTWLLPLARLDSPAAGRSGQPQLAAAGDRAILSWVEQADGKATLKIADRTSSGWSQPRVVASGDDWFVNWADVPSVVRLQDGTLAAHWLQKSASSTYAYDVRLSLSKDDGKTWGPSFAPHHDGTRTEHGFASLFQMPGAGLGLTWLDGRQMREGAHEGMDAGAMSLRATIYDTTGRQLSESLVDDRVCECCPTTTAVTSEGPMVAFRNRSEDEIRDIYVSRFVAGKWTQPVPVHRDNWKIAACPVNGPSLGARDKNVAIAWFTAQGDQGRVYVAFSTDAGATFGDPIRVDDVSALGRVDVELLPDGSAAVAWIEYADQKAQFRIRRVQRGGTRSVSTNLAGISANRSSGYPRVARRGNELIFAWTDTSDGTSGVQTAVASLFLGPAGQQGF